MVRSPLLVAKLEFDAGLSPRRDASALVSARSGTLVVRGEMLVAE